MVNNPDKHSSHTISYENLLNSLNGSILILLFCFLAREAPQIEIHPKEPQSIRVGESAMLSCRAIAGIPSPTVVWSRRDQSPFSHRINEEYPGTILISDVTLGEAGEYECKASNIVGEVSQTVPLHVQQTPVITLKPDVTELKLTEGDELKLECEAVGIPAPTVRWQDPSAQPETRLFAAGFPGLGDVSSRAVLQRYNIRRSDAGTYICQATNEAGSEEKYITVLVETKRGDVGKCQMVRISSSNSKFNPIYSNIQI